MLTVLIIIAIIVFTGLYIMRRSQRGAFDPRQRASAPGPSRLGKGK
jgi:hypothetical protein